MDMFVCFACVLFVILGQPQTEIDQQIVRKQEELALLDEAVEKRREERQALETQTQQVADEALARAKQVEDEARARVAQLEAEIASTREQLAKRQQEFTDWDVVVDRFTKYADGVVRNPDLHVYLRPNGAYAAASPKQKLSRDALLSWLTVTTEEFTRLHPTKEGEKPQSLYVALYVENGANDTYRTAMSVIDEINREKYRVRADFVTLPSGVIAGKGYHLKAD
ncbi:MAG: hypothetical protein AAB413_04925 [Patescibacteria group bacterium]